MPSSNPYAQLSEEPSSRAPAAPTSPTTPSSASPAPAPSSPLSLPPCRFSVGNPLPMKSLKKRCERAAFVLADFLSHAQEQAIINDETIRNAKGLVFISMIKGGYVWSGRIGCGLVIAKTNQNTWSAPSAISCFGVGYGAQVGLEFTDYVLILKDDQALNAFTQTGNLMVGGNLALCVGPWGRTGSLDLAATCGLAYSLSKSRGLFAGLSIEGTVLFENKRVNEACYGKGVTSRELLSGQVPVNQEVSVLHQALYQRFYAHLAPASSPAPAGMPAPNAVPPASPFSQPQVYGLPATANPYPPLPTPPAPSTSSSSSPPPSSLPPPPPYHPNGQTDDKAALLQS